jgi:hypothetical protein
LACILYCATLTCEEPVANLSGIAEQPVIQYEFLDLRVYWSEVVTPDALVEGPSRKAAEQRYRQVLRDVISHATALSFAYPALVADMEEMKKLLSESRERYREALTRLAGSVQYELTATWSDSAGSDLATPVSGKEYLKRRQESEARVAAIDIKLRAVTSGVVLDWRTRRDRRNHLWYALMPRDARDQFIATLRSAGPSQGVRLKLSGPWPPDDFANLNDA